MLAAFIVSCQNDEGQPLTSGNDPIAVGFTLIGDGELMGDENITGSNLVIDNEADWNALKTQMDLFNPYSQYFTETDIDFSAYKVIAVIDELRTSGGYDITIASITDNDGQLVVDVENSNPTEANVTTVMTQPFHIIKIPNTDLPVVFE